MVFTTPKAGRDSASGAAITTLWLSVAGTGGSPGGGGEGGGGEGGGEGEASEVCKVTAKMATKALQRSIIAVIFVTCR